MKQTHLVALVCLAVAGASSPALVAPTDPAAVPTTSLAPKVTAGPEKRRIRVGGGLQNAPRLHKRADDTQSDSDTQSDNTQSDKTQTDNTQSQTDKSQSQTDKSQTDKSQSQTDKSESQTDTQSDKSESKTDASTEATSSGSTTGGMPTLDSSSSSKSAGALPTLHLSTGSASQTVPTPDVTVPSMADNPYMTSSSYPEGTVFIAVGAILGGLGLAILAWRMFASISLSRSLKKSGSLDPLMGAAPDDKLFYPGDPSRAGDVAQSASDLRKSNAQSLFFSPTAEVMNSANSGGAFGAQDNSGSFSSSMGNNNMTQRSSVYLPAGYYTPGGGPATGSMTSRHVSMARESLYAPSIRPSSTYLQPGTPQTNAPHAPQQRAPSAYLDDLLDHE